MTVEVRAVDAGELRLPVDDHATTAAHTGAVDHHRVHRDGRRHAVLFGQFADRAHHRERADGYHLVEFFAGVEFFLKFVGNEALVSVRAVVGRDDQLVGRRRHFVVENDEVDASKADDGGNFRAERLELFRLRVSDGRAETAADDRDFFEPFERRRDAERADEVENGVAGFELREVLRRFADRLNDDRNAAFFAVVIGDREGDAFAELVDAQDDELPRFRFFSDGRREDFHQKYLRIQGLFSEDFVGHLVFDSKRRK